MPDAPVFHYHLALALKEQGESAQARQELEKSLASGIEFHGRTEALQFLEDWN